MPVARVFKSGNSQAVRLPKEFRVNCNELQIERRGKEIVLREKSGGMKEAFELIASLPEEVLTIRRRRDKPQKHKGL